MTTKAQLIDIVYTKTGVARKDVEASVNQFFIALKEALVADPTTDINLPDFGKFSVQHREAREGRNPATGEALHIEASNSPKFKPSNSFKNMF